MSNLQYTNENESQPSEWFTKISDRERLFEQSVRAERGRRERYERTRETMAHVYREMRTRAACAELKETTNRVNPMRKTALVIRLSLSLSHIHSFRFVSV
jgi:hypothetical protein